ncbi:hypothetical protein HXX76_009795 [Chlamydomonas incerta]|uniref:PAS domain-containing protein n=1 Tax=Chlamydomonas incerta TaxID=51695 RepID=A0A835SYZ8_CHLIN|nr:hypothetical protein HXX76_009795 [Chlamydomonas incerta]|eukprot:KAG2430819.1 hypothetical protein HXX76_009795 [Chlamydomonas incerta]
MTSYGFAFFRLFIDFLQLWLLVVNPAYGFDIDADNPGWKAVSLINLSWFLQERGYMFFLVLFYIFVGLLLLNVGLSVWVAYQFSNNRFDQVWPIVFLRWFGLIFYQVLDVATLTLLLAALDCQYFSVPKDVQFHNQVFPAVQCWAMPHLIHVAVSVVTIIVFVVMAGAMVVSQMDLNPMTRHYMAIMHTRIEGYSFIIKTIATIASVMLNSTKWLSILYFVCFVTLTYLNNKWVPYTYAAPNYARGASYMAILYSSVLLIVIAFGSPSNPDKREDFQRLVTVALWIGLGPAAIVGAVACHLRLRKFTVTTINSFKNAELGTKPKYIFRFTDAREVELVLRHCRQWLDEDTPEPDAVALGETVVKAGMTQLSTKPQMIILYSSFLIDVQGSYQSGYTQLQAAKKQSPGILERFAIFSREQEHAQKASGANGGAGAAVDLVSYVEFQRSHRQVTRAHKEALMAMRAFWGLLMHSNVNFIKLTKAMNRIEVTVRAAERAYRTVLTRHSTNARLVRLYGRFLESVKFDPWAASKWFAEAERLEERDEHAKEAMQLGGMVDGLPGNSAGGFVEGVAVVFINSQGTIQVASPEAHVMLGYQKNELKGKDLGVLLPPPFSDRHNAYVRNYIHSGKAHVLDKQNDFVVLTKSHSVVPIRLRVSKVSGMSEDSVFMGALEPLPSPPGMARAWLLGGSSSSTATTGASSVSTLIAADDRLFDLLGYEQADLVGQPVSSAVADADTLSSAIAHLWSVRNREAASGPAAAVRGHKNRRQSIMSPDTPGGGAMRMLGFGGGDEKSVHPGRGSFTQQPTPNPNENKIPSLTFSLEWKHKYSGPVPFTTILTPGTFGSVRYLLVTLQADWKVAVPRPGGRGLPGVLSELMLVADNKGKILHVTTALAAALGRTADSIRQGGIDMLLPEPYTILHGPWLSALAMPPGQAVAGGLDANTPAPPYSCRSGVAVSLCGFSEAEGPVTRPFKLQMQHRILPNKGLNRVHVLSLEQLTKEQVVSEHRLKLTVDMNGGITGADDAPAKLFGVDPKSLVGKALGELVDLFRTDEALRTINDTVGEMAGEGRKGTGSGSGAKVDEDLLAGVAGVFNAANSRQTTRMLLELARRSSESDGISWRVGVTLPPDPAAAAELEELSRTLGRDDVAVASRLIGGKVVPAVMRVRLVKRPAAASISSNNSAPAFKRDSSFGASPENSGGGRSTQRWAINWSDQSSMPVAHGASGAQLADRQRHSSTGLFHIPPPPLSPLPPAPSPPPPGLDFGGLSGGLDAQGRPMTPGSLKLANDLDRPNSLRLAAPPDLRRAATSSSAAAPGGLSTTQGQGASMAGGNGTTGSNSVRRTASVTMAQPGGPVSPNYGAADSVASAAAADGTTGARAGGSSLTIEVELWRADLLTGVVEVDERGRVLRIDPTDDLGQAALVLGAAKAELTGCNINSLLPLPQGVPGLFSGDGLGPGQLRGALKSRTRDRNKQASGVNTLSGRHMGDGCGFAVSVQAVKRSGHHGTTYVIMRPFEPTPTQPGFVRWLAEGDTSGLAPRTQLGYRDTAVGYSMRDTAQGLRETAQGLGAGAANGPAAATANVVKMLTSAFMSDPAALPRSSSMGQMLRAGSMSQLPQQQTSSSGEPLADGSAAGAAGMAHAASLPLAAAASPPPLPPQLQLSGGLDNLRVAPMRPGAARAASRFSSEANLAAAAAAGASLTMPGSTGGEDSAYDPAHPRITNTSIISESAMAGMDGDGAAGAANPLGGAVQKLLARGPNASRTGMSVVPEDGPAGVGSTLSPRTSAALLLGDGGAGSGRLLAGVPEDLGLEGEPLEPKAAEGSGSAKEATLANVSAWVLTGGQQCVATESTPPGALKVMMAGGGGKGGDSDGSGGDDDDEGGSGSGEGDRLSSDEGDAKGTKAAKDTAATAMLVERSAESGTGRSAEESGVDGMGSEAGAHVTNYGAGKRFKKIYKLLMSPQAQRASWMLWIKSLSTVVLLLAAHTVTFVLLLTRLELQQSNIVELESMGNAVIRIHEIALRCRTLSEMFRAAADFGPNGTDLPKPLVAGTPYFGLPYEEAIPGVLELMQEAVVDMKDLQHGIYLGFDHPRRIPTTYGLRDVWDLPQLKITKYFDRNDKEGRVQATKPPFVIVPTNETAIGPLPYDNATLASADVDPNHVESVVVNMGLWEAGNMFVAQALDVQQNALTLVQRGVDFDGMASNRFVQGNGMTQLWPAYLKSLDAETQITVEKGRSVYILQLVMLCMEGGALCLLASIFIWYSTQQFVGTRYALYSVFVHLPLGLTRTLANMSITLEPGEEEDEDPALTQNAEDAAEREKEKEKEKDAKFEGGGKSMRMDSAVFGHGGGKSGIFASITGHARRGSVVVVGDDPPPRPSQAGYKGGVGGSSVLSGGSGGGFWSALAFWRPRHGSNKVHPAASSGSKRRLVPSSRTAFLMMLPFLIWGVVVVCINMAGFAQLYGNDAPIASLGVMHAVVARFHRVLFYSMALAGAMAHSPGQVEAYRSILRTELLECKLEYSVLLYGEEALIYSDFNSSFRDHLQTAPRGILFEGGGRTSDVLFKASGCMALDPAECQPEDSPLYEVTRNGLDVLFKSQLLAVESLINQDVFNSSAGGLNSTEFRLLWSTFETDMEGGVTLLGDVYKEHVQSAYRAVETQQIILFVAACVWAFFFIAIQLRPFLRRAHLEMRRIAELLSQLPPEVDVETMVARVVLGVDVKAAQAAASSGGKPAAPTLMSMKSGRM